VTGTSGTPLRILSVTTSYPRCPGDFSGHFVHALNARLVELGHEVTVLAPHAEGLSAEETWDGVRIVRFRYGPESLERVAYGDGIPSNVRHDPRAVLGLPGFALGLRAAVRAHAGRADVVHVNWAPTAALAGRTLAGSAVVLTLHGSDATLARRGGVWRWLLVAGLRRALRVVVVAKDQAAFLRAAGLTDLPVTSIASGIDPALLERERPVRDADSPFTFLFAGRLVREKGVRDLFEAYRRLARAHADVRLTFAGGGPEEDALRERAVAAGLSGRVRFLGAIGHDEALEAIATADALVLPSYGEGSPLSVTEALALGTPVVGTRVGAVPELLGLDGLLTDPGDADALTHAMGRLFDDEHLRGHLAHEGRRRAAERYTWPKVAEAYVRVFREAVGE
jgi:glycosyltransferase involved in cell wall biosynthesis